MFRRLCVLAWRPFEGDDGRLVRLWPCNTTCVAFAGVRAMLYCMLYCMWWFVVGFCVFCVFCVAHWREGRCYFIVAIFNMTTLDCWIGCGGVSGFLAFGFFWISGVATVADGQSELAHARYERLYRRICIRME
jgi:hypothetical protein